MSRYLNIKIIIPTEDLEGEMDVVRHVIRVKFSMVAEDVIRFVENNRVVKPSKEWIN